MTPPERIKAMATKLQRLKQQELPPAWVDRVERCLDDLTAVATKTDELSELRAAQLCADAQHVLDGVQLAIRLGG